MATRKKKADVKKLSKYKLSQQIISNGLAFIGRPFYLVLSYLLIGTIALFYFVGSKTDNILRRAKKFADKLKTKSREKILFKARDLKLKRKHRTFKIKLTFFQEIDLSFFPKIRFGTKLKIFFSIILIISIFGLTVWYFIFRGLPSASDLISRKIDVSTRIYDRNGILLYQIYEDQNRTPIKLSQIPDSVKAATLASEDINFYSEPGFSLKGIVRAIVTNVTNQSLDAGGSTITQQLVKNALLTNEKTFTRKIKELVLALEVEKEFSKDEIFLMYLNQVSYGGTAYGIQAASQTYFGKEASQLDLAESALLAGLPKSPTTYSPFGANPGLATERQRQVLKLMADNKFISDAQMKEAENEKLKYATNTTDIKAPHFVMFVRQELVDEYGEDQVLSGGLNVTTTLDYNIQKMAESVVKKHVDGLKGFHVTNGAAIVLDPSTGEVLAMVGSKDYFDTENDGNVNVTTALRPPGSSIKIVNYAYALSHGYTPATIILDEPITYKFPGSPSYSPVNYDGKFVGNITLRNALAESRNIPAVKVLASYGVENMIKMGQAMGITTWNEVDTYGLSLTLGGGSTKLIDLARVFATVANMGSKPPIVTIKSVTNFKGNKFASGCPTETCEKNQVLDERVAYQLIDILKDNNARAPEFGSRSALVVNKHPEVAVKTGTSNSLRDNLTIGFNQKYLTAVWVGNNDNSPMSRIASGITGAAPIWNEIMSNLLAKEPSVKWTVPSGLKEIPCRIKSEFFLSETNTANLCNIREGTPSAQVVNN